MVRFLFKNNPIYHHNPPPPSPYPPPDNNKYVIITNKLEQVPCLNVILQNIYSMVNNTYQQIYINKYPYQYIKSFSLPTPDIETIHTCLSSSKYNVSSLNKSVINHSEFYNNFLKFSNLIDVSSYKFSINISSELNEIIFNSQVSINLESGASFETLIILSLVFCGMFLLIFTCLIKCGLFRFNKVNNINKN